ncbi:MAG: alpha/beta hydrolase family protein [Actinomycetota bacterium]
MSSVRHPTRRALGTLVVSLAVLGAGVGTAATAAAGGGGDRETEATPLGSYAVGKVIETFVDGSRATDAVGTFAGAPDRTLKTTIYYPVKGTYVEDEIADDAAPAKKGGPYPLILFSHGLTANAAVYEGVISEWVSAGYVVAAPDYPLSNTNAPGGNVFANGLGDVKNQPADASFVIDEMLALSKESGPLRGMVDKKHIGASGHSLGGMTTLGLVYSSCCIDERIDAAAPMSGVAALVAEPNTYFTGVDTPLLVLHGDADPLVPYRAGQDAYANASAPKFLVTFVGAGHIQPFVGAEGPQGDVLVASGVAFWDYFLKDDPAGLDRLEDADADPAVATLQEEPGTA